MLTTWIVAASFVASAVLTGLARRYALHRGVLDHPNERSSHSTPTPRGGGIAVVAASVGGMALLALAHAVAVHEALVLTVGMALIAAIGWLDDHTNVAPAVRLAVHATIAILTVAEFRGLPAISLGTTSLHLGVLGAVLAVVAIVWSINLFNFMDGIDGLAGSEATLVFAAAAALLAFRGDAPLAGLAAVIAASAAGFLCWNWPPARIFLGDVGSGALGYMIAAVAIAAERHGSVSLLAIAMVYGVFVGDATVTLIRRIARGERPAEAHRSHAYQRLSRAWGAHQPVTLAAAAVTVILALLALAATVRPALLPAMLAAAAVFLAALLYLIERVAPLSRIELAKAGDGAP